MSLEEDYRNLKQSAEAKINGEAENNISRNRFSSLLVSKDRNFLLSPDGTKVFPFSSLSSSVYFIVSLNYTAQQLASQRKLSFLYLLKKKKSTGFLLSFHVTW